MAEAEREPAALPPPDMGRAIERAGLPWLGSPRARIAAMHDQGRLPHGILLFGQPGAGQLELGLWIAARLLCRGDRSRPCGDCTDCKLLRAGSHPDFRLVGLLPDKKDILIEQVRSLSEALSLRSYRGGVKVALVEPAETMNIKSFNALLKTLEEPSDDTFLLLATSHSDRIPRTIASRCMRLRLPLPATSEAMSWLDATGPRPGWAGLLSLANGAPFLALDYAETGLEGLDREMQEALLAAGEGRGGLVAFAESWAKNAPAARLSWLESWLTRNLKEASLPSDLVNNNRLPWLRQPGLESKIRAGYELLDQLRDARRLVTSPLNTALLFEGLLVALSALLGKAGGKVQESID